MFICTRNNKKIQNMSRLTYAIKTAFLYGIVEENVCIYVEGYNCKGKVFKLKKAELYKLKL